MTTVVTEMWWHYTNNYLVNVNKLNWHEYKWMVVLKVQCGPMVLLKRGPNPLGKPSNIGLLLTSTPESHST